MHIRLEKKNLPSCHTERLSPSSKERGKIFRHTPKSTPNLGDMAYETTVWPCLQEKVLAYKPVVQVINN